MFLQGKVVYANYGRKEDLENLKNLGLDLKEKIALIRAGKLTLAEKVPQISTTALTAQFLHSVLHVTLLLSHHPPGGECGPVRISCGSDLSGAEKRERSQH